jgi:hypothetical protein
MVNEAINLTWAKSGEHEVLVSAWEASASSRRHGGAGMGECHCLIRASALPYYLRIETMRARHAHPLSYPPWSSGDVQPATVLFANAQSCSCAIVLVCNQRRLLSRLSMVSLTSQSGYAAPFDASPYLFTASDRSYKICFIVCATALPVRRGFVS